MSYRPRRARKRFVAPGLECRRQRAKAEPVRGLAHSVGSQTMHGPGKGAKSRSALQQACHRQFKR